MRSLVDKNSTLDLFFGKQEADFFIGDLTVTYERSQAVEFSFLTLVDSELFLTHSPGLLNEALALIRPFHWIVRNFYGYYAIVGIITFGVICLGMASYTRHFTVIWSGIISIRNGIQFAKSSS